MAEQRTNASQDPEKQSLLRQFTRSYPKYLKANRKITYPIMDECLVQYSPIFKEQFVGKRPEGVPMTVFTTVTFNQLLEISTFNNSFPNSPYFSVYSDTPYMGTQFSTYFLRVLNQVINETHTPQALGKINLYTQPETQEFMDRMNFKFIGFFIEDLFKYKMNILQPKDIYKQKVTEAEPLTKKEKKDKKSRNSLLTIVEKEEQQFQQDDENKESVLEQLQFENFLDPTCGPFWGLVYDLFNNFIKKLSKLQQVEQTNVEKEIIPPQQQQDMKVTTKFPLDEQSIIQRRKQQIRNYTNIRLKEYTKSQNKSFQQIKNLKYIDGQALNQLESERLGRLIKCFASSWPEFVLQAVKIPYIKNMMSEQTLKLIAKLTEDKDGYFKFTAKERSFLTQGLCEAVIETDCFRQIIEYRSEMISILCEEWEEIGKVLEEINTGIKKGEDNDLQQQYRLFFKKYLQIIEFQKLFVNGSQLLGQDVKGNDYYVFANNAMSILYKQLNEWFELKTSQVQDLMQSLNIHGIKEKELQFNIQRLLACEFIGDEQTQDLLNVKPQELKTNICGKSIRLLIQRTLREAENKMTKTFMIKRLRWEVPRIRQHFHETIENCQDMRAFSQLIVMFAQQFEKVQQLKFNGKQLKNAKFNDYELKSIENCLGPGNLDENILFENYNIFALMEREQVIYHTGIVKTQFWQLSIGEKIKSQLIQYSEKVDPNGYYSVYFLANILSLACDEFSASFLQGEKIDLNKEDDIIDLSD